MRTRRSAPGRLRGRAAHAILAATLLVGAPAAGAAQVEHVAGGVGGAAVGAVVGVYTTTAIYVTKARLGSFLYSMNDLLRVSWETLPVLAGPVAGGVLGGAQPGRLGRTALWGAGGFALGAGLGFALGSLLGDTTEETWAGGIIGSAAGLLAGSIAGALGGSHEAERPILVFELPLRPPVLGGAP